MSNPNKLQRDRDELDLETEKIVDLDVKADDAEDVRGGKTTCNNNSCYNGSAIGL